VAAKRPVQMRVAVKGNETVITLEGIINEFSNLDVSGIAQGTPVVLDTGGVVNINSLGVRSWLIFIEALCKRASRVVIRRLAAVLVVQTAAIRRFLGTATVASYLAPWECPACERTIDILQDSGVHPPVPHCPKCGAAMVLDDLPDWYLGFQGRSSQAR